MSRLMLLAWTARVAAVAHGAALSDATPAAADHIPAAAVHTTSLAVLSRQARAVCSGNSCLWDNAVVPYWYDSGSLGGRLSTTRTRFAQAIANIEAKTVLTFRPKRSGDTHWITIKHGGCGAGAAGCSHVGVVGSHGPIISFMDNYHNDLHVHMHELTHSLGLLHEQQRFDRDLYFVNAAAAATDDAVNWGCGYSNSPCGVATHCANEGGSCNCNGIMRYGAGSSWTARRSTGNTGCNNGVFGNPIRGARKSCTCSAGTDTSGGVPYDFASITAYPMRLQESCGFLGWGRCDIYNVRFTAAGRALHAAQGRPEVGRRRNDLSDLDGQTLNVAYGAPARHCAGEGGTCRCNGVVRYGAGQQDRHWRTRRVLGSVGCTNGVFGDPIHGTTKSCTCASFADAGAPVPSPPTAPPLPPPSGGSCMSGNTGTFKASPISNSSGFDRTVAIVKELQVGDTIEGLDAEKNPALCTVEAIGQFGHGPLFGNYTDDHFVLDPATGGIKQHGAVGNRTVEDKYEVMTSCPVGLDEAGTGFTPMDGDFCGQATAEMAWSDYLLIHASMLRIIRATGGYWLSASAYSDFDSVVEHGPELCAAMLACAGPETDCDELERVSELFIDHYLTEDARNASHVGMPGLGKVGAPGSASFVVSQGNADNDKSISTEGIVLIASAAVLAATVAAVLVVAAVRRKKRSTPAMINIETEPITDSSAIKDDSAV